MQSSKQMHRLPILLVSFFGKILLLLRLHSLCIAPPEEWGWGVYRRFLSHRHFFRSPNLNPHNFDTPPLTSKKKYCPPPPHLTSKTFNWTQVVQYVEAWWSSGYVHIRLRICRSRFKLCHGIVSFKVDADCFFLRQR